MKAMNTLHLDDVAFLRVNPGLDFDHRVPAGHPDAVRLFVGNDTGMGRFLRCASFIQRNKAINSIDLAKGAIVVQNHYSRFCYPTFRVESSDLPAVLAPQFILILPRDRDINCDYLFIAIRSSLTTYSQQMRASASRPLPLTPRVLRELSLHWPSPTEQARIAQDYQTTERLIRSSEQRRDHLHAQLCVNSKSTRTTRMPKQPSIFSGLSFSPSGSATDESYAEHPSATSQVRSLP